MKNLFAKIFVYCFVILQGSNLYGATIFASPEGKNTNNGSISSPYDFQTAIGRLNAGDTLWVRGGIYYSDRTPGFNISRSGTSGRLIHIFAYPEETPVFDFRKQPYGKETPTGGTGSDNVGLKFNNYTHIKGLVARYAGKNGIHVESNCVVENCVVYGNCDSGFQIKGGNNTIMNCDSYRNFDYKSLQSDNVSPNYGGNADGFADSKKIRRPGTTNTYIGCRSWENSDDGWDFYGVVGNSIIRDCWVWDMGPAYFDLTDYPRFHDNRTDSLYAVRFKNEHSKIIIPSYGNGNGFKMGGGTTSGSTTDWAINDIILTNCVAFGIGNTGGNSHTAKAFDQNNNHGRMELYNCTAYGNNRNYGFTYNTQVDSLIIINCISAKGTGSNSFSPSKQRIIYNNWNLSINVTDADFVSVDSDEIRNVVRDADGNLPKINLLRLASTSPCIDSGINVGLPYYGAAPDLGAFEYIPNGSGISSPTLISSINLYPNPVVDYATLVFESTLSGVVQIRIMDVSGKVIKFQENNIVPGQNEIVINCSDLPKGIYYCKITCSSINSGCKLIK